MSSAVLSSRVWIIMGSLFAHKITVFDRFKVLRRIFNYSFNYSCVHELDLHRCHVNDFHTIGSLWGDRQRAIGAELRCVLCSELVISLKQIVRWPVTWDTMAFIWPLCNVHTRKNVGEVFILVFCCLKDIYIYIFNIFPEPFAFLLPSWQRYSIIFGIKHHFG